MSMKFIPGHFELPEIYEKSKEHLVDDSIMAYELLLYICKNRINIAICEQPGSGKTFFTKLFEKLPEFGYLKAFQDRKNNKPSEKKPKVTPSINTPAESINELYEKTLIFRIDLGEVATEILKTLGAKRDFIEHHLIHYINNAVINHVIDQTTKLQVNSENPTKLENNQNELVALKGDNDAIKNSLKSGNKRPPVVLEELRSLYKKIAWVIHLQIMRRELKIKNYDKQNVAIGNFVIIMDDVNTMIGKSRVDGKCELEDVRNNFLTKTIFLDLKPNKRSNGPFRIQYISCSILPFNVKRGDYMYPKLEKFSEYNINSLHSFDEFSVEHLAKLVYQRYSAKPINPSNIYKLIDTLANNEHEIKPFLEMGLPKREVKVLDKLWKDIYNASKYIMGLKYIDPNVIETRTLKRAVLQFFMAILGQPKYNVCRIMEYTISAHEQAYKLKVEMEKSNNDIEQKFGIGKIMNSDELHETKLNTRRILNFLMAQSLRGSIYLRKSYRFSTELATIDFWNFIEKLDSSVITDNEFNMSITVEEFKGLFETDIMAMHQDSSNIYNLKPAWYMYNAGYITADYIYGGSEEKEQFVKLKWTNHQKRISFLGEQESYAFEKLHPKIDGKEDSRDTISSYF